MWAYKKLNVYQKAQEWVVAVYLLLKKFPIEERYALCDQIRRAAFSVTSNIAEGMSRNSNKEIVHFIEFSYGSLMEVQSQLEIAVMLNYITKEDLDQIEPLTEEIARMLSGLRNRFRETRDEGRETREGMKGTRDGVAND